MFGKKLQLGWFDYSAYSAFTIYSISSLVIPLILVGMAQDLNFPLTAGGMAAGGGLHLCRSIAMVVALLFCSVIAGKLGKRRTMAICMLLMGMGILICAFAPGYWLLLPCLALAGIGEGVCEGIATPFVENLHSDAPERYVNIAHSFWSVGIGLCVLGTGILLAHQVSWRIILGLTGILGLFSALLFFPPRRWQKIYPERQEATGSFRGTWECSKQIFRHKRFWLYCSGMFVGAGAEFCLTFWSATFLQLNFHTSAWISGLGTAAIAVGMFVGRNFFGLIATENNLKKILLFTSLGTAPLTLALISVKPEQFASPYLMLAVLLFLLFWCGIGIAPYWPTLQVYGVKQLPELDSTMLYIYFSAMGIPGCGFFTWLIGVLGDHFGLRGAFILIPLTCLLYASLIFYDGWLRPLVLKPRATDCH